MMAGGQEGVAREYIGGGRKHVIRPCEKLWEDCRAVLGEKRISDISKGELGKKTLWNPQ